jgi:uncharacterized protein YndB with AHSA1/START domain
MRSPGIFDGLASLGLHIEISEEQGGGSPMSAGTGRVLRLERSFAASAERVFDAWTSPEVMRRWFHAGPDWGTSDAEVDLRVGGRVRVVMRKSDGSEVEMGGEYTLIDRPRRLAMTWTFGDHPDNRQLIELTFTESGDSTTVLMVNSSISTERRREAQEVGWGLCLDELEAALNG